MKEFKNKERARSSAAKYIVKYLKMSRKLARKKLLNYVKILPTTDDHHYTAPHTWQPLEPKLFPSSMLGRGCYNAPRNTSIQNGVARPRDYTDPGKVWFIADYFSRLKGSYTGFKPVADAALGLGIRHDAARQQYLLWRKYRGVKPYRDNNWD